MLLRVLLFVALLALPTTGRAEQPLPPVHDGAVLEGPGEFRHDGELFIQGRVVFRNMTLHLHGPIRVASGATFEMDGVHLVVSDPVGAANGTSGLRCEGPAHLIVHRSTMDPAGSAHPMWRLEGELEVDDFATTNSEFHLNRVEGRLDRLKIFELEISQHSQVTARGLDLVFLSTHSSNDDHLRFEGIPIEKAFTRKIDLGSGASVELKDSRLQVFLLYVEGHAEASLVDMDRVQLAISPQCSGRLRLPRGRLGSVANPAAFPDAKTSDCPFHISLENVNVDTWDVYAAGHASLTLYDSQIDELVASDHATIVVDHSNLYADWLAIAGNASVTVEDSTVGALTLARERPDLATSQVRVSGRGRASFSRVRFDCGIVAEDNATVSIIHAVTPPKYARHSGDSVVRIDGQTNPAPQ